MPSLLVVDDTPIIRAMIAQVVSRDTKLSPVLQAATGAEAIIAARRHRPDIILMDIKMPGIDGLQASAAIKAEQPRTRIILLSAHNELPLAQGSPPLGPADYLLKPIQPARLIDILAQVCADLLAERVPPDPTSSDEQGGGAPPPHEVPSLVSADLIQQALDDIRQNPQPPHPSLQQLISLRINAARRLLHSTSLTINAIGEAGMIPTDLRPQAGEAC